MTFEAYGGATLPRPDEPVETFIRTGVARAEAEIRQALDHGDVGAATTLAIRRYGPEIFGFLLTSHEEPDASDVFAATVEALWKALPIFSWRSSLRTWLYVIARSHSARQRRGERRRRARFVPLEQHASAMASIATVRSETLSCLRTGPRSVAALRALLSPEDRELLVLRLDRELGWRDLARVFSGEDATEVALDREAARLRKRFQVIRARLLVEGRARGMLSPRTDGG